jgi:Holliday junction resolvasome RuvABC DNA-binding subunit
MERMTDQFIEELSKEIAVEHSSAVTATRASEEKIYKETLIDADYILTWLRSLGYTVVKIEEAFTTIDEKK